MESFQVIQPSGLLAPYVKQYWFLTMNNVKYGCQRLIPFGCVALTFQREGQTRFLNDGVLSPSSLSGQSEVYTNLIYSGNINFISVIFQPAGAMTFFDIPMAELNNRQIALDVLNDSELLELEKKLHDITDNKICVSLLEKFLLKRINCFESYNYKRLSAVIKNLNRGENDISILAQTACLGYKQFKRIFSENIGINPKNYLRICRFQRASYTLQTNPQITLSNLSEECGYHDKSHLIKDFKEFSGYSPGEFLSVCDPYSDYHSLFRSAFIDSYTDQIIN